MITEFEARVLRAIRQQRPISGNGMVAWSAAARRLERKGLAVKGAHWYITDAGRRCLIEIPPKEEPPCS